MSTTLPRVTVITPAYNRASLIEETIRSVLDQDYPNLEYIVLDDGSSDGTLDVIRRFRDRVRWDTHPNMGETRTVNKGFSMARGDIIGVLSSDDPLLPGAIRKSVDLLLRKPDVMVVYPDWRMIDIDGRPVQSIISHEFEGAADMIRRHRCLPGPGAFFRRSVVEALRGRDERIRYVADLDFWFRAGLLGRFERIPETLACFRTHTASVTVSNQGVAMAAEHVTVLDNLYARPDLPPEVLAAKREAYSSAYYMAGCCCGRPSLRAMYFLRAISCTPLLYAGRYAGRLVMMLLVLAGMSNVRADLLLQRLATPFRSRRGDPERPPRSPPGETTPPNDDTETGADAAPSDPPPLVAKKS